MKGTANFGPHTPAMNEAHLGCVIDNSAFSADSLDHQIIQYAVNYGMKFDTPVDEKMWLAVDDQMSRDGIAWVTSDLSEWLRESSDAAVDWLNEHVAQEEHGFFIDDNSIFYGHVEDEGPLEFTLIAPPTEKEASD